MRPPHSLRPALAAGLLCALAAGPAAAQSGYSRVARRDAGDAGRVVQVSDQFEVDRSFNDATLRSRGRVGGTFDAATIDARQVSTSLNEFTAELNALYKVLLAEQRTTPSLRAYLAEVNTYAVDADLIARDVADARSVVRHEQELRELDAGWNRTARAIKAIPRLSRTAERAVDATNAADRRVEQALAIGTPTLDRALLQRTATGLYYAIMNLAAEIEYGVSVAADAERRALLQACNSAAQQAKRIEQALYAGYDADRARMIEEYRRLTQLTRPVVSALRTSGDRGVGRAVRGVQDLQREMSDILLIDRTLDRDELRYMSGDLEADVERFFAKTNLDVLRDIPRAEEALATADAFWGVFENFRYELKNSEEPADWADAYGYIDQQWTDFRAIFGAINSDQARADLKEIEAGMASLREALSLSDRFDRSAVAELAGGIEANAYSIKRDGEQWLRQANPRTRPPPCGTWCGTRRWPGSSTSRRSAAPTCRPSAGRATTCSSSGRSSTATSSSARPASGPTSPRPPATPPRPSAPCRPR